MSNATALRHTIASKKAIALARAAMLTFVCALALSTGVDAEESQREETKRSLQQKVDEYTVKLRSDPKNAFLYHERAECMGALGRNKEALADHTKSIQLQAKPIRYLIARGDFYQSVVQSELATADYVKALAIEPSNAEDYYWQAEVLKNLHQYEQAFERCNSAISGGFKSHRAYRLRGRCYFILDKPDKSLKDYDKALSLVRTPSTYISIARCYRRMAKSSLCLKALAEAKKLDPKYPDIYYETALTEYLLNHFDKSKENYMIWIGSLSKAPELSTWEAFVRFAEIERKLDEYGRMLALSQTSNADLLYDRAMLYMEHGHYESASYEFDRYLKASKWSGTSGVLAASYTYLAHRMSGHNARARSVQAEAEKKLRRQDWPFPIFQYLTEKISRQKLESLATDKQDKTQAFFFEAMCDIRHRKPAEAKKKFEWIIEKGDKSLDEHELAKAELRRLAHRARVAFPVPAN